MFENFKVPKELKPSDPRFGAGPSLVPVEFLKRLEQTGHEYMGTSHRKPAVKNVVKSIQDGLKSYFDTPDDYQVLLGNGGATLLFDMIGLGMVEKQSSHFTCGEFSGKWFKAHNKIPWIKAIEHSVDFGQGIIAHNNEGSDVICTTLNETSTGVIVPEFPEVDDKTILAVDATSGGGQVPCDLSQVDCYYFSPQKVFASDGGLWIAIMSPKAIDRVLKIADDKSRYIPDIMSWKTAVDNGLKNQTYNTPALATLFFLDQQIKSMNLIGYEKIKNESWEKANHLYEWAESKEYLEPYVQEQKFRSNAVATINVDDKYPVSELLNVLSAQGAVYNIDAYRKLGKNQFRIGLFHNIKLEDLKKLTQLLSLAIEKQ